MNIDRSVQIPMANKTTSGTLELPLTQRHVLDSSASAACLACIPSIYFNQLPTACYSLVRQHFDEVIPGSIGNMFGEMMIFDEAFDIKIFNSNCAESAYQSSAAFVQEVGPLVSYLDVELCNSETGFASVLASFEFSTQSPLQNLQTLFYLEQMPWITDSFSVGQSGKVLKSDINTNRLFGRMNDFRGFNFTGENSEPLSCLITFDSQSLDLAFWNSVEFDRNVSNFGSIQSSIGQEFESTLRERDTYDSGLEARKTLLLAGLVFHSAKEIGKSFMNSVRNILDNLTMNRILSFDDLVEIKLPESLAFRFVSLDAQLKKFVIDLLTGMKGIKEPLLMLIRRIKSIPIYPEFHKRLENV